jgi:hypothetical protein
VSLTALFRRSKVRQKIFSKKSKIYKKFQNAIKIKKTLNYFQEVLSHENRWKKCIIYSQLRDLTIFFLRKTKIFQKFKKPTKKYVSYDIE